MASNRITFICPTTSQPRHQRRAKALIPLFQDAVSICWDRGHYRENKWPDSVRQVLLPEAKDGNYLQRLLAFPKALKKAKAEIRSFNGPQVLYAFSIDCCIIANLSRRKGDLVIWEMGDLVNTSISSKWKRTLVEKIEQWNLKRTNYMVMTSQKMFDIHYPKLDPTSPKRLIVIENRLGDEFRPTGGTTKEKVGVPLRLGWSGLLRGERIYERFLDAVAADGGKRVTLGIWGGGPGADMANEYAAKYPNIKMYGTYREDPESVLAIHQQIDLQIILNDTTNLNVTTQLTNRLFQSLIYETPMIACKGTENGERVVKMGVGMMVDGENEDWNALFDNLIDGVMITKWLGVMKQVPEELRYLDSRELVAKVQAWIDQNT